MRTGSADFVERERARSHEYDGKTVLFSDAVAPAAAKRVLGE